MTVINVLEWARTKLWAKLTLGVATSPTLLRDAMYNAMMMIITGPRCVWGPVYGHFGHFAHFQAWSPRVAKGFQGPRGTPGMGEMSYNQIDHI